MTDRGCADFHLASAELALGVLPVEERGPALAHLAGCGDCRTRLRGDVAVSDGLLGLFPAHEPPIGFEQRVAARIGDDVPQRRRPRVAVAAAVVALAMAAGAVGGGLVTSGLLGTSGSGGSGGSGGAGREGPGVPAAALLDAPLLSGGKQVGEVYAYAGSPPWVYMAVDLAHGESVSCQLLRRDGSAVTIGTFRVAAGRGYWGAPSPVSSATLAGARILAADGTVLASASFSGGR